MPLSSVVVSLESKLFCLLQFCTEMALCNEEKHFNLRLHCFYKAGILFRLQCSCLSNKIVQWFQMIGL